MHRPPPTHTHKRYWFCFSGEPWWNNIIYSNYMTLQERWSTVSALDIGFGQSTAGPSPSSPQEGGYKPHEYRGCSTAFPQRGCIPGSFPILMWAENTETFTSRSAGSCTCFDHLILGTFSVFFLSLQNLTSGPPGCCFASDNAPGASPQSAFLVHSPVVIAPSLMVLNQQYSLQWTHQSLECSFGWIKDEGGRELSCNVVNNCLLSCWTSSSSWTFLKVPDLFTCIWI